jgi:hypothetical protein
MRFTDNYVSVEHRYSLGVEEDGGTYFLSIPVTNGIVDYEEYYRLSDSEYSKLMDNQEKAQAFAEQCRKQEHDERLLQKPGWNRGKPI